MNAVSIHKDNLEILREYSDGELGLLLRSLMADIFEEEEVKLPPELTVIKKYINNQNARFSKQQSEKGKKPKQPNEPTQPNKPIEPMQPSVSEAVSETLKDSKTSSRPESPAATSATTETPGKKQYDHDDKYYLAAKWLSEHAIENSPRKMREPTETNLQSWADTFRLMETADHLPWDDIRDVLAWTVKDSFWKKNILSAGTFREKYNQLVAKMSGGNNGNEKQSEYKHKDFTPYGNGVDVWYHDGPLDPRTLDITEDQVEAMLHDTS
jgi:hypothetical protein